MEGKIEKKEERKKKKTIDSLECVKEMEKENKNLA